jgi:hypothetical protein
VLRASLAVYNGPTRLCAVLMMNAASKERNTNGRKEGRKEVTKEKEILEIRMFISSVFIKSRLSFCERTD